MKIVAKYVGYAVLIVYCCALTASVLLRDPVIW
jgi:hypothetical protein